MCKWDEFSETYFDCGGKRKCYCRKPEENMCNQEDMEYYSRFDDREPPRQMIMSCDTCSEPLECCACPKCIHCGEENVSIVEIACPIEKCVDIADRVCISCKNIHDTEHGL